MSYLNPFINSFASLNRICTTKSYDHYTITGSEFNTMRAGADTRNGILIITASPAIGTYIKKVKFSAKKTGSPTGDMTVCVRNDSDTILVSTTLDVSTLTTSYADYEVTMSDNVLLALNYRVACEYSGGDASNRVNIEGKAETTETGYNCFNYNGSYNDFTGFNGAITFDSTPTCP